MSSANDQQVGGDHYKRAAGSFQHWDWVLRNQVPYLEAQVTRYLVRHRDKNGIEDVRKALHYAAKLREWYVGVVKTHHAEALALRRYPTTPFSWKQLSDAYTVTDNREHHILDLCSCWWLMTNPQGALSDLHDAIKELVESYPGGHTPLKQPRDQDTVDNLRNAFQDGECVCQYMVAIYNGLPTSFHMSWKCPTHGEHRINGKGPGSGAAVLTAYPELIAPIVDELEPESMPPHVDSGEPQARGYVDQDGRPARGGEPDKRPLPPGQAYASPETRATYDAPERDQDMSAPRYFLLNMTKLPAGATSLPPTTNALVGSLVEFNGAIFELSREDDGEQRWKWACSADACPYCSGRDGAHGATCPAAA